MVFRQYKLLTTLLIIGVLGSAWGLSRRHYVEMSNRAIEVAVDYSEVAALAGATHKSTQDVLAALKKAGATTVAVQEQTYADLVDSGVATVVRKPGPVTEITGIDSENWISLGRPVGTIRFDASPEYVLALPFGFSAAAIEDARNAGMPVVARLVNYPGLRIDEVSTSAQELKKLGIGTVIFASDQVLGFRGAVDDVAEVFKENGLRYGSVEFSKQKGDQRMSREMMPDVIRVHSITSAEIGNLDRPTAVERFVRAARERNIRILYVRMFDFSDADPLQANVNYIKSIASGMSAEGLGIKPARPFDDLNIPVAARVLIAVGMAAGVMLLVLSVVRLPRWLVWVLSVAAIVVLCGFATSGMVIGLKAAALLTATVFPTLAVLYAATHTPDMPRSSALSAYLSPAVGRFLAAIAISFAGGLMIAGMLSTNLFMLHIDQFAGVKLASVLPLMTLAGLFAASVGWGAAGWREQVDRAVAAVNRLASQPILLWQAGLAFILMVMVAMLVMRSGNEPGVGVSALELKFRSILDTILFVRPRTKEFLVGHPAMFLGIAAALGGRRSLAAVLLVIGAFGEISLVNTFCHIHTPIAISIIRSAIGAALGLVIGVVVLLVISSVGNYGRSRTIQSPDRGRVGVEK